MFNVTLFLLILDFLASTTLKAALLFAGVWLVTHLMRRSSAASRHLLWSLAFVGTLVIMAGHWVLPHWQMPAPFPAGQLFTIGQTSQSGMTVSLEGLSAAGLGSVPEHGAGPPAVSRWPGLILAVWAAGFLAVWIRYLAGFYWVLRLTKASVAATDLELDGLLGEISAALGLKRPLQVRWGSRNISPLTWGLRNAVVLLPPAARAWSPERLRMVLLHEGAHVRRRDFVQMLLVRLTCSIHWFNPLAWKALDCLSRERERACDDHVLAQGNRASDYANHLLDIARSLAKGGFAAGLSLHIARHSELEGRLISILDDRNPRRKAGRFTEPFSKRDAGGFAKRFTSVCGLILCLLAFLVLAAFSPWPSGTRAAPRQAASTPSAPTHAHSGEPQWPAGFSRGEQEYLAERGISAAYVEGLVAMGYKNLTAEHVLSFKKMNFDPNSQSHLSAGQTFSVCLIESPAKLCMLADTLLNRDAVALQIQGDAFFGLPGCTLTLARVSQLRFTRDPLSGKTVNKARAVAGALPDGRLLYFENEQNLQRYNQLLQQ